MRHLLLVLFCLSITGNVFPRNVLINAQDEVTHCDGDHIARLVVGGTAQISPGDANRLRLQPSTTADVLGSITAGEIVDVLDGPICADGFTWWYINYTGLSGWMADGQGDDYYWLIPIPVDYAQFEFEGVSLAIPSDVADGAEAVRIEESTAYDPPHIEITFDHYPDTHIQAKLKISLVEDYEAMPYQSLDDLRAQLDERPSFDAEGIYRSNRIANSSFTVKTAYIDFENGAGIRYIYFWSHNYGSIPGSLRYEFVGLTDDGKYYIEAMLPIHNEDIFLNEETRYPENYREGYAGYIEANALLFGAAPPESYRPNIEQLDTMFQSLHVAVEEPDCGILPSRLQIGDRVQSVLGEGSLAVWDYPLGTQVQTLQPGEVVSLVDGPVCSEEMIWWQVNKADTWTGWLVEAADEEYTIVPLDETE